MSVCMYKLRPTVSHDDPLPVPSHNMYHMKPVQAGLSREERAPQTTVRLADISGRVQELIQESKGDMSNLEERQEDILKKIAKLRNEFEELRVSLKQPTQATGASAFSPSDASTPLCPELGNSREVVIYASPEHPPYSLLGLTHLWGTSCRLELKNHTHSSVKEVPSVASVFSNTVSGTPHLRLTLVWKEVGPNTQLIVNPVKHIAVQGESNILRFLSRVGPVHFAYENNPDLQSVARLDEVLDNCERFARSSAVKEKQSLIRSFNASLAKSDWLCGQSKLSIADLAVWSVLKQMGASASLTPLLSKWMERCDSLLL